MLCQRDASQSTNIINFPNREALHLKKCVTTSIGSAAANAEKRNGVSPVRKVTSTHTVYSLNKE